MRQVEVDCSLSLPVAEKEEEEEQEVKVEVEEAAKSNLWAGVKIYLEREIYGPVLEDLLRCRRRPRCRVYVIVGTTGGGGGHR